MKTILLSVLIAFALAGAASAAPPLKPPTNVTASGGDQKVTLNWSAST